MVFVVLVVRYTPVTRTGSWDIRIVGFFLISFGSPARLIGGCLLILDVIVGFGPAALPKEATYPFLEAPGVGKVFTGADGFRYTLFCVTFGSASRAFGGGGIVEFEKPEDGDAADNHDEGERYDEHPKADGRSSKLRDLKIVRSPTWKGLGFGCWLNGDRTRRGLTWVRMNQTSIRLSTEMNLTGLPFFCTFFPFARATGREYLENRRRDGDESLEVALKQ
jgi:hypothetical protein